MIQLTAMYGQPQDQAAFDRHYQQTHSVLAQKIPGQKGYVTYKPAAINLQEPSPYYLIGDLFFENMAVMQAALQSPEAQATTEDLQNFATGGATLVAGEVQVHHPVSFG